MNLFKYFHNILVLLTFVSAFGAASTAFGAATIVIAINDPAGVGFNDTTPVTPIGGNPGTTLGEQRLNAFQEAARIWGETLSSNPTITIRAQWTGLPCTATSAVLGSAGAANILNNFPNAPFLNTWYSAALANKLSDADLIPTNPEINANFNVNLGKPNCLNGSPFYLGYDGNEGTGVDLVAVLLHEFGHGLGFQTFTSGTSGAPMSGLPSVYDRFLLDNTTGKSWLNMTNAERVASALNSRNLAWNGPQVQADVPSVLALGTPLLRINTPTAIAGVYPVGTASFGPALTSPGITTDLVQAIDPNEGSAGATTTDGCSLFSNASAVAGNIALVDRGLCGFVVKALNAQNAGAVALVVADNAAGGPPAGLGGADPNIIIPAVRITLDAGNLIKAQLASGVSATLTLDNTVRQGADTFGKALVYTPNPFQSGSSVSHWDTGASPNLLMEPSINADLTHQVTANADLTYSLFQDLGWTPSILPSVILSSGGNLQTAGVNQPFAAPLQVTVNPAVEGLTVTFKANATDGASGTFATSGSRPETNGGDAAAVITNTPLATAVTNAQGVATSPVFSANGRAGTYSVNATVPGAGSTTFQLINLAPTAAEASVSGRILTADGRGIMGALVTLTTQNGEQRTVRSNGFGYYGFNHLAVSETIVVEATSKKYSFQTQVLTLSSDFADFNFVALP